jgi:hypothetical protein
MIAVLQVVVLPSLTQASSWPLNFKPSEIEKEGIPTPAKLKRSEREQNLVLAGAPSLSFECPEWEPFALFLSWTPDCPNQLNHSQSCCSLVRK